MAFVYVIMSKDQILGTFGGRKRARAVALQYVEEEAKCSDDIEIEHCVVGISLYSDRGAEEGRTCEVIRCELE